MNGLWRQTWVWNKRKILRKVLHTTECEKENLQGRTKLQVFLMNFRMQEKALDVLEEYGMTTWIQARQNRKGTGFLSKHETRDKAEVSKFRGVLYWLMIVCWLLKRYIFQKKSSKNIIKIVSYFKISTITNIISAFLPE